MCEPKVEILFSFSFDLLQACICMLVCVYKNRLKYLQKWISKTTVITETWRKSIIFNYLRNYHIQLKLI